MSGSDHVRDSPETMDTVSSILNDTHKLSGEVYSNEVLILLCFEYALTHAHAHAHRPNKTSQHFLNCYPSAI